MSAVFWRESLPTEGDHEMIVLKRSTVEEMLKGIEGPVTFLTNKEDHRVFPISLTDPKAQAAINTPKHREILERIIQQSTGERGGDYRKHLEEFAQAHSEEAQRMGREAFVRHVGSKLGGKGGEELGEVAGRVYDATQDTLAVLTGRLAALNDRLGGMQRNHTREGGDDLKADADALSKDIMQEARATPDRERKKRLVGMVHDASALSPLVDRHIEDLEYWENSKPSEKLESTGELLKRVSDGLQTLVKWHEYAQNEGMKSGGDLGSTLRDIEGSEAAKSSVEMDDVRSALNLLLEEHSFGDEDRHANLLARHILIPYGMSQVWGTLPGVKDAFDLQRKEAGDIYHEKWDAARLGARDPEFDRDPHAYADEKLRERIGGRSVLKAQGEQAGTPSDRVSAAGLTIIPKMTTPSQRGKSPRPVWEVSGRTFGYETALENAGGKKYNGAWSFWEDPTEAIADELESTGRTSFAERKKAEARAAGERADRLSDRAGKHQAEADAQFKRADRISERFAMGQPILVGHHSERGARRDQERIFSAMGKSVSERDYADSLASRAAYNEAKAQDNPSVRFMVDRQHEAEAGVRDVDRRMVQAAGTEHAKVLERRKQDFQEQVDYWKGRVEEKGGVQHSSETVGVGDVVNHRGQLYPVKRVNPTSVTVGNWLGSEKLEYKVPYHEIKEVHKTKESREPKAVKAVEVAKPADPVRKQIQSTIWKSISMSRRKGSGEGKQVRIEDDWVKFKDMDDSDLMRLGSFHGYEGVPLQDHASMPEYGLELLSPDHKRRVTQHVDRSEKPERIIQQDDGSVRVERRTNYGGREGHIIPQGTGEDVFPVPSTGVLKGEKLLKNMAKGAREMLKGAADAWSEDVPEHVKDISRVLESMREELDAVNQYALRIVRTKDTDLAEILAHNKKEEIEHFVMLIEYARKKYPEFDEVMREVLFGGENGEPKLTRAMLRMRGIVADRAVEKGFDCDDNTPECIKCADAMQGVHP